MYDSNKYLLSIASSIRFTKSYDINNNLINCLYTAHKLCEWLEQCDGQNSIYMIINKLQIMK